LQRLNTAAWRSVQTKTAQLTMPSYDHIHAPSLSLDINKLHSGFINPASTMASFDPNPVQFEIARRTFKRTTLDLFSKEMQPKEHSETVRKGPSEEH
jgi:hypothetical protein